MFGQCLFGPLLGLLGLGLDLIETRQARKHLGGYIQSVDVILEFIQTTLALFQSPIVIAFLREPRLGLHAPILEHRIDVTTEQRADVDLHRLATQIVLIDLVSVDRAGFVLGKQNCNFRANSRTGRAIGFAVGLILDRDLLVLIHAVDIKQAKAQALHAVGAPIVIDHWEPRLPMRAGFRDPCCDALDVLQEALKGVALDIARVNLEHTGIGVKVGLLLECS